MHQSARSRRTVAGWGTLRGKGMQSGCDVGVTLKPGSVGSGLVFTRSDLADRPAVEAVVANVSSTDRRTALRSGEASVEMVEHLLAAVSAHGIDDLLIEGDGAEPPAGDGSADMFFREIERIGVVEIGGKKRYIEPQEDFEFVFGSSRYELTPGARTISVTIEFPNLLIGRQDISLPMTQESFKAELSCARTWGFAHEISQLQGRGLFRGVDSGMGILLSETNVENGPLRWPDEFVRHKVVDLMGDLVLLGAELMGSVKAYKPSHRGNIAFVNELKAKFGNGE